MSRLANDLQYLIKKYKLENRDKIWSEVSLLLDHGALNDRHCQYYLLEAKALIKHLEETGNWLPRPPKKEELYGEEVTPNIKLGSLLENPDVELGFLIPPSHHIFIIGATGAGKSTTIRTLITEIERLRKRE